MTAKQFAQGLGFSMLTGGILQGISALSNGRGFWTGNIKPIPTPVPTIVLETPKMGLNKDALRAKMENLPDEVVRTPDSQTFLRVESGDGKVSWVKVDAGETGTRVFWSGGEEAMNAAANYAKANGMTILEMTRAGQNLTKLTDGMPWAKARPFWERLSSVYAKGAEGTVHFFSGPNVNPAGIWSTVERDLLKSNKVTIITH